MTLQQQLPRVAGLAALLLVGCPSIKDSLSLQATRISQEDVDNGRYSVAELFDFGGFLFDHTFTPEEGLGNSLYGGLAGTNARPNSRAIHRGRFGGPDGKNCQQCHTVGGPNGGGRLEDNLFQDGDGVTLESALVRNPPSLLGVGYLQALAAEMSLDLATQIGSPDRTPHPLCHLQPQALRPVRLVSKGVDFGSYLVACDGVVDSVQLDGVDRDLVVKPLGWKGRTALLRRFVEGGFQVHFGMAADTLIQRHCTSPIPEVVGDGRRCEDPDDDGVEHEITEGQLTSMAIWNLLLPVPTQQWPTQPDVLLQAQRGQELFGVVGCAACHVPELRLDSPVVVERPDLTNGQGTTMDLTVDGKEPRLERQADGSVLVPLFSDLKRHAMGSTLADAHATFGVLRADQFLTPPLWGVATTPPYMHDGRAASLHDAILLHAGDSQDAQDAYAALSPSDQQALLSFLNTLTREPGNDAAYELPWWPF